MHMWMPRPVRGRRIQMVVIRMGGRVIKECKGRRKRVEREKVLFRNRGVGA